MTKICTIILIIFATVFSGCSNDKPNIKTETNPKATTKAEELQRKEYEQLKKIADTKVTLTEKNSIGFKSTTHRL